METRCLNKIFCLWAGAVVLIAYLTVLSPSFSSVFLFKNSSVEMLAMICYRGRASRHGSKTRQFCRVYHNTQTQNGPHQLQTRTQTPATSEWKNYTYTVWELRALEKLWFIKRSIFYCSSGDSRILNRKHSPWLLIWGYFLPKQIRKLPRHVLSQSSALLLGWSSRYWDCVFWLRSGKKWIGEEL